MELLDFLRNTENPLQVIQDKYAIKVRRSETYHNLVLLKYDQIHSDFHNPIVQQCRGIIVNENDNWNVVCYAFSKFFNVHEGLAAQIDWSTARVYEKLDGSLMQLYYYDGEWQVASSGTPGAYGSVFNTDWTLRTLFWNVWKDLGYKRPANTKMCYAFELCTPYNIVVVPHKTSRIVLHGARKMSDLKEVNPIVVAYENNWECVKTFPLQTIEAVKEATKSIKACDGEGFVVCDEKFNRIKVKSIEYITLAHLKEGFSTRKMLELVRINETSEFLTHFPQYEKDYYETKIKYESLVNRIEGFYDGIKDIEDRKAFALKATTQNFSAVLFAMKFKSMVVREYLAKMQIKILEDWLGIKFVEVGL